MKHHKSDKLESNEQILFEFLSFNHQYGPVSGCACEHRSSRRTDVGPLGEEAQHISTGSQVSYAELE